MTKQYILTENEIRTEYLLNNVSYEELNEYIKNAFSNDLNVTLDNAEAYFITPKIYKVIKESLAYEISEDPSSFLPTEIIEDLQHDNPFELVIKMNDKSTIFLTSNQLNF